MADGSELVDIPSTIYQALKALCCCGRNRKRRRKVHKPLDNHRIAKADKSKPRKAQVEDLKAFLARVIQVGDQNDKDVALVKRTKDKISPELIKGQPLASLQKPDIVEAVKQKDAALGRIQQTTMEQRSLLKNQLELYEDVFGDLTDETVTPEFKEKLQEHMVALRAQKTAEEELNTLKTKVEILQARLERAEELSRRGLGGWKWSRRPIEEELGHSKTAAKFLESTKDCYDHAVNTSFEGFFSLRATEGWALNSMSGDALRNAEHYDFFTQCLKVQRQNLFNARWGYQNMVDEGAKDDIPLKEIGQKHAQKVLFYTKKIRGTELLLKKYRDLAIKEGVKLLPVPNEWGDDPVTEPAITILGDGETASLGAEVVQKTMKRLDGPAIEEWIQSTEGERSNKPQDQVISPPSVPSSRLSSCSESSVDSDDASLPGQRSPIQVEIEPGRLRPNDSGSMRDTRTNRRRKISTHHDHRVTQRLIDADQLSPDTKFRGMRYG